MEPDTRIGCLGSGDHTFVADVVVAAGTIIDMVPMVVPPAFWQVRRPSPEWTSDATTWPVFVVDAGARPDTWPEGLPLMVSDPSVVPADLPARLHVRVTGHLDDARARACRPPPEGSIGSEMTDEQAVFRCRAAFVVTAIEPLD